MTRRSPFLLLLTLVALLAAGCDALPGGVGPAVPRPCPAAFSTARCDAILVWAANAGIDPTQVVNVEIVPLPTPEFQFPPDRRIGVRLSLAGGGTEDTVIQCAGLAGAFDPPCMETPGLRLSISAGEAYHDVPVGATEVPEADASAVAAAKALPIDRIEIPISRTGQQRVLLGQASLANGIIRSAPADLAEDWPANVVFTGGLTVEITPAAGGDPIWNIYEHGWREGVELVDVTVVFDAALVRPGAVLTLIDVIVR